MTLIVAGTGHRPEDCEAEEIVRTKVRNKLRYSDATTFITGMAAGLDLWAGDEARILGLELWCARPWAGHAARKQDTGLYDELIAYASRVVNVNESEKYPGPWVYHKRNEWMVDNADVVLSYWNPEKKSGGTFACRNYAIKVEKPLVNLWHSPPF